MTAFFFSLPSLNLLPCIETFHLPSSIDLLKLSLNACALVEDVAPRNSLNSMHGRTWIRKWGGDVIGNMLVEPSKNIRK